MIELDYSSKSFFLNDGNDILVYRMKEYFIVTKHRKTDWTEYPNVFLFSEEFLNKNFNLIRNFYEEFTDHEFDWLDNPGCFPVLEVSDEEFEIVLSFMESCFGKIEVMEATGDVHI